MTFIQPYISTILEALVGLLVVFLLGVIRSLRVKAETWLQSHTTDLQLATVHKLASEATALVETTYNDAGGAAKLAAACGYVADRLKILGISYNAQSIQAAIEKAVQDFNMKGVQADATKEFEQH